MIVCIVVSGHKIDRSMWELNQLSKYICGVSCKSRVEEYKEMKKVHNIVCWDSKMETSIYSNLTKSSEKLKF